MAYDEQLAVRMRDLMKATPGFEEKKMFGGIGFLIHGNMAGGVHGQHMIIRLNPDKYEEALGEPFTAPFDLTGRPMRGWVTVSPDGYTSDEGLNYWLQRGIAFALTLPAK